MNFKSVLFGLLCIAGAVTSARAQTVPSEIKIGKLYASTGPYAAISMPVQNSMKMWVDQVNAEGGVFVKPYNKKIPVKLISYDDQSSTATAATMYNQLITQDKVDLLVTDSGSVMTSVAVPIAKEHKQFLFNVSGTGAAFFTPDNPYIALITSPVSTVYPKIVADFLNTAGVEHGIKSVAILYSTNDFTGTQAKWFKTYIEQAGKIKIVYDQGVPTTTSNYTVLINNIAGAKADAVVHLGYVGNDIAFFRNLQESGEHFKFAFGIYVGMEEEELVQTVGATGLTDVFSYVPPTVANRRPDFGPTLAEYRAMWDKAFPNGSGGAFGANAIYGYLTGQIIEQALARTKSLDQLDIREAVFSMSGKLKTLAGNFELASDGSQTGELMPLGQLQSDGKGGVKLVVLEPPDLATGKPIFAK
ncbi:MAG: ABC transporter substrate-binding protein [Rhodopila sp.]|nr:ABC transporter substrate-binding protein [Rhodopila sp.]